MNKFAAFAKAEYNLAAAKAAMREAMQEARLNATDLDDIVANLSDLECRRIAMLLVQVRVKDLPLSVALNVLDTYLL